MDLLLALVLKINARAERKVERELTEDLRRVRGKEGILFRLAGQRSTTPTTRCGRRCSRWSARTRCATWSARRRPTSGRSRPGSAPCCAARTPHHYRRMLPPLLAALEFRCNNTAYRPVMDALELLASYAARRRQAAVLRPPTRPPIDGVVPAAWREAVVDEHGRVERIPYELCVLVALRDAIRRREVLRRRRAGGGATPRTTCPATSTPPATSHYAALRQPTDPTEFIADLRQRMTDALDRLDHGAGRRHRRRGEDHDPARRAVDQVPKLAALARAADTCRRSRTRCCRRWGTLDLLDVLKDADFLDRVHPRVHLGRVRGRSSTATTLRRRLLLCLFALGTNMGIQAIVATGEHGETEAALRHVRRHFITRDNLRRAIAELVNATFAARDPHWWGAGTACAIGLEEVRLLGVEPDDRVAPPLRRARGDDLLARRARERLHLLASSSRCSSSEVAAMIEGLLRHCTDADIDSQLRRHPRRLAWSGSRSPNCSASGCCRG